MNKFIFMLPLIALSYHTIKIPTDPIHRENYKAQVELIESLGVDAVIPMKPQWDYYSKTSLKTLPSLSELKPSDVEGIKFLAIMEGYSMLDETNERVNKMVVDKMKSLGFKLRLEIVRPNEHNRTYLFSNV